MIQKAVYQNHQGEVVEDFDELLSSHAADVMEYVRSTMGEIYDKASEEDKRVLYRVGERQLCGESFRLVPHTAVGYKYVAFDGRKFDDHSDCRDYESIVVRDIQMAPISVGEFMRVLLSKDATLADDFRQLCIMYAKANLPMRG